MDQVQLANLFSGLIGTFVGVLATLSMSRASKRSDAVDKMLALVFEIGFVSWSSEANKPALELYKNLQSCRSLINFSKIRCLSTRRRSFVKSGKNL